MRQHSLFLRQGKEGNNAGHDGDGRSDGGEAGLEEGRVPEFLHLPGPDVLDLLLEGPLPGVHLDDLHPVDDLVHDPNPLVRLLGRHQPQPGEHPPDPALQGHEEEDEGGPHDGGGPDLLPGEEDDDGELEGGGPEVVDEEGAVVVAVHVVGEEVDHLADRLFAQGRVAQSQGL